MHRLRLFGTALVVCALLVACARTRDDRIELRYSFWGAYQELAIWKQIKAEFEALHPDVRVKLEYIPADYRSKVRLQMIAGTAADVVAIDDETQAGFSARGHLEVLDPYIARDAEELKIRDFLPTSLESFQFHGRQYAMPWDGFSVLMYCNLDLFDQEGIPYPDTSWTWEDFRRIAIRLTKDYDGDGRIDQFGTNLSFGFLATEPILWAYGADIITPDGMRCGLFTPEAIAAIEFIRRLVLVDNASPQAGQMPGIQAEIAILTGKLAMVPGGAYLMPNLRATEGMRWDVFHMPKGPARRATRVSWDGIGIYAKSRKKELAWEFIKYVLSRKGQEHIGESGRAMPVRRQDVLDFFVRDDTPQHEERFLEATAYGFLTPATTKYEALDLLVNRWLDRVRLGILDVPTALAHLTREFDELLEEERREWAEADTAAAPIRPTVRYGER